MATTIEPGRLCDACHAANPVFQAPVFDLVFCGHHGNKHREALNAQANAFVDRSYRELCDSTSVATRVGV